MSADPRACAPRAPATFANVLVLGYDHIWGEIAQAFGIDAGDRQAALDNVLDLIVDHGAGALGRQFAGGADRQIAGAGRKIAFVTAPNEVIGEAQRADDFGGTRQQRNDAGFGHGGKLGS